MIISHPPPSYYMHSLQPTVGPNGVVEPQILGAATKETTTEGGKGTAARDPTLSSGTIADRKRTLGEWGLL